MKYKIVKPELLLFVDKVGANTSQREDGNIGGEKLLVAKDKWAFCQSAMNDCHFTMLGFTSTSGEPVCCVVIVAAQKMEALVPMGYQPWAEIQGNGEQDIVANSNGDDKLYPMDPMCTYLGYDVPCLITCTESGLITSTILHDCLHHINKHVQWPEGQCPALLLDGHQSRFEQDFLTYINNDETKWHAAIGVLYGTHLWQVGDSSEQNGVFKMELVCQKQFVLEKKMEIGLDFKLEKKNIIGMVRRAFPLAFGNVENNKKATAGCGWNLLNWVLLDHPDI